MEALQRLHNRGSISTGYDIDNSLKLEADNNEYLQKANDSGTNRKTFTVSMWFKRTELANDYMQLWQGGVNGEGTRLGFYGGTPKEAIWVDVGGGSGNTGADYRSYSVQVLRDTAAWYHIVLAVDTTQGTAANRLKVWLNGDEITTWTNQAIPAQDFQCSLEANINMQWGAYNATYYKMCGYIAECHYLDGVAKVQTDFGEYDEDSGIWKPKAYTGTYGGNGCYLNFDDSSDLGKDSSGNGNNFTLNNITSADQATDTPTNNFAIGNAIVYFSNPTMTTFNAITEGGTKITKGAGGWETLSSTIAVTRGKWYMEMQNIVMPETAMMSVFPADIEFLFRGGQINNYAGKVSGDGGISYYSYGGTKYVSGATAASYGTSWANETNTMAIALDMDNGKVYFARANAWQNSGDPTSGATGTGAIDLIEPTKPHMMGYGIYANNTSGAVNFGGYTPSSISSAASDANGYGNFEYAPPSGYYALCTKNLEEYG
jgi:hypothetical protein